MHMMREFGFFTTFIDFVFRTVSNNWFSVVINGMVGVFFKSFRGVRQGDPLSPALFVITFVDDMIISTRLSRKSLAGVKKLLDYYQAVAGQKINIGKSSFFCSHKVSPAKIRVVAGITGFQWEKFPFKYLQVSLFKGWNR